MGVFFLDIQQNRFRFLCAFHHRMNELHEARVLWLLQAAHQAILHHRHELSVAQLAVHWKM